MMYIVPWNVSEEINGGEKFSNFHKEPYIFFDKNFVKAPGVVMNHDINRFHESFLVEGTKILCYPLHNVEIAAILSHTFLEKIS